MTTAAGPSGSQGGGSPSPQDRQEGLKTLEALVAELGHPGGDLVSMTRRARYAYEQLGLADGAAFLSKELEGYAQADQLPDYRRVGVHRVWKTGHQWARIRNSQKPSGELVGSIDTFELRGSLASIAQYAGNGFTTPTGRTKELGFLSFGTPEQVTWWEEIVVGGDAIRVSLELFRESLHRGIAGQ